LVKGTEALEQNPKDFYAFLYLAGACGNQTRYNVYISKSYLGALSPGIKGYKHIKSAQALKPDYIDCLIGIGAYNYFAGAVPAVIKPIAWMFYAPGNKAEGIRQLQIVAAKGEFGQIEAKTVLLGVYLNEKRWVEYQTLNKELIKQFPSNPVFYMWLAAPFVTQKRWDGGIKQFSELINNDTANGSKANLAYVFHQKGRLELEKRDLEMAIQSFNQVLTRQSKNENLLARTYLLRGYAYDLLGQRNLALADYQATVNLPNVEDTHRKARQHLKTPYSGTR
jgi:tetratricopeptide (TPR) repeat protein